MIKMLSEIVTGFSLIFFLAFTIQVSDANATEGKAVTGEKMTFEVRWSFVVAGEATIRFIPGEKLNDMDVNHYLFTARTSKYVDLLYKVRDRIDSYTDTELTRSIYYKQSHRAGSRKEVIVKFDWEKNTAQYSKNGKKKDPISISPDTYDPLSVFFAFRARFSDNPNEIRVNVTDGKRSINGVTKIIKKEKIKVAGKSYNTVLVEPEMNGVGGIFNKAEGSSIKIWITDDGLRIPVRFKSEVTVGSFVADLISYERNIPE